MSDVTILLGGPLRHLHPDCRHGELQLPLEAPLRVAELLERIGVPAARARVLLLNHRKAYLDSLVRAGDRLAVFPPELAFNMYVALELAHDGRSEEDT